MKIDHAVKSSEMTSEQRRQQMVVLIESEARLTEPYTGKSKFGQIVMEAMATVPRHEFVSERQQELAYYNGPLPIGHNQTISQPYIVALMTDLLNINNESVVLEIGTGSGYQTAVLAEITKQVYSIEIIEPLYQQTQSCLDRLGYFNVKLKIGDGSSGWLEYAPYDGIIVTAAAASIPPALIEQLKPNSRLVIPVESESYHQDLILVSKTEKGSITKESILPVAFVPLKQPAEQSD